MSFHPYNRAKQIEPVVQDPVSVVKFKTPSIAPNEVEFEVSIGKGSFGEVFKGTCRGQVVAVKVLNKQNLPEKALREFEREVILISKYTHPNIVQFMGACFVPDHMMIVTEFIPRGDLEDMLADSSIKLSMTTRMKMAKGAALGMNWLHLSEHTFIHRDLKTKNLLVGEGNIIKICDFGLSQVKQSPDAVLRDPPNGAKGTPIWMAPEILMNREFNEKCDIYSFGIVLWEILTVSQAFEDIEDDLPSFIHRVCEEGFRPDIPEDCQPRIRDLLISCWNKNPKKRPTFSMIIHELDLILVDVAINDSKGRDLWHINFLGKESVEWEDFRSKLFEYLLLKLSFSDIQIKCLEAVLAESPTDLMVKSKIVNITRFGQVCAWFGPLKSGADNMVLLINLTNILKEKWFHGDLTQVEAEDRLNSQSKGTFLIRFSSSSPGCFTISHINKSKNLCHQRVTYVPGKGFYFWEDRYDTLRDLIKDQRKKQYFVTPCPGSTYQKLFPKKSRRGQPAVQEQGGAYVVQKP